jgi:hypothetical protein
VLHVVELKTNGPAASLDPLAGRFGAAVAEIHRHLEPLGARLLPTAMHPRFDPRHETRLWPHGQNEIYEAYDRIFGCEGHGWSNLQSMHINLPFFDASEFVRLHEAIRLVLPLIPALAASSPMVESQWSGWMDARLRYYRDNQRRIPEIAGWIVPEPVDSIADYEERILGPMYKAIAPHDPTGILAEDWLNSRGAIARFERQTIEIRVIDIQECPAADLALAEAVVALVRRFFESESLLDRGRELSTEALSGQLFAAAREGGRVRFEHLPWLSVVAGRDRPVEGTTLWRELLSDLPLSSASTELLERMTRRGTLAEAIRAAIGDRPDHAAIDACYRELAQCLRSNRLFTP